MVVAERRHTLVADIRPTGTSSHRTLRAHRPSARLPGCRRRDQLKADLEEEKALKDELNKQVAPLHSSSTQ